MKLRVSIDDKDGPRQYEGSDVTALRNAAHLLLDIADGHDPDGLDRTTFAAHIDRINLTWEA